MFMPLPTASMSLGQLFAEMNAFTVPVYQRPYSWSEEQAGKLLEDVAYAAGLEEGQPIENDYFFGAILLLDPRAMAADAASFGADAAFEIVDGQQRLLTMTLLAAVLRDLQPETPLAVQLHGLIQRHDAAGNRHGFRIALTGEDGEFIARYVQEAGGTAQRPENPDVLSAGQRALLEARDAIVRELRGIDARQRDMLSVYLCERCHFVVVTTFDIDRAHRIFMVLNDRGRPLHQKDILKAEILKSIEPENRDAAVSLWIDAEKRLGDELDNFFSHLRTAFGYGRTQVIHGVRRVIAEAGGEDAFMHRVFRPMVDAYATVLAASDPGSEMPDAVRRPIVRMQRLSGKDWLPAVLRVLIRAETPEEVVPYLEEIERAACLMRLVCMGASKRFSRVNHIIAALSAPELPDPHSLYEPTREELRTVSYNFRDLHARNGKICKALLMRFNDDVQPEALFVDPQKFTVEHVLPQRPKQTSLWRKWFPDTEERMVYTASLGNLVLVTPPANTKARNDEYDKKREIYRAGAPVVDRLAITDEVMQSETWQSDAIRAREMHLLQRLSEIWRIEIAAAPTDELVD